MKNAIEIITNKFKSSSQDNPVICEYINSPFGIVKAPQSFLSSERKCEWCDGKEYIAIHVDPNISGSKTWLCLNGDCMVYKGRSMPREYQHTFNGKRSILWPEFCEINGIGDKHHEVTFEKIKQNPEKISFLLSFAKDPDGIILMRGGTGRGKTFCAMGVCELFTRTSISAIFITQNKMSKKWLENDPNFINQIEKTSILVVDDFGTGEIAPGFMKYFMDLINLRIQWKKRGTIITTNLSNDELSNICGDALLNRIQTGILFEFKESKSRRF